MPMSIPGSLSGYPLLLVSRGEQVVRSAGVKVEAKNGPKTPPYQMGEVALWIRYQSLEMTGMDGERAHCYETPKVALQTKFDILPDMKFQSSTWWWPHWDLLSSQEPLQVLDAAKAAHQGRDWGGYHLAGDHCCDLALYKKIQLNWFEFGYR